MKKFENKGRGFIKLEPAKLQRIKRLQDDIRFKELYQKGDTTALRAEIGQIELSLRKERFAKMTHKVQIINRLGKLLLADSTIDYEANQRINQMRREMQDKQIEKEKEKFHDKDGFEVKENLLHTIDFQDMFSNSNLCKKPKPWKLSFKQFLIDDMYK